jgi:fatty acid desaturase
MHDASHGALGNKPALWTPVGVLSNDFLNGSSFYGWLHQHILGHHQYCNTAGVDPDVRPFPFRMDKHQVCALVVRRRPLKVVSDASHRAGQRPVETGPLRPSAV